MEMEAPFDGLLVNPVVFYVSNELYLGIEK